MPAELRRLEAFLHETSALAEAPDFPARVVAGMRHLIACDAIAYNEVELAAGRMAFLMDPADAVQPGFEARFVELAHEHPIIAHHLRTGDGSARQFSDFVTGPELHALAIYQEIYKPIDGEHQIAIVLPGTPGTVVGIALNRRHRGFTERERQLLNLARAHLSVAYRNAVLYGRARQALATASGLTVDGVVVLDEAGGVEYASPRARTLLATYFGEGGLVRAAVVLREWLDGGHDDHRLPALVRERGGHRLVVRQLVGGDGGRILVLEERERAATRLSVLSPRQREVLDWVAAGKTDAEIGEILGVSPRTVQKHLERVYDLLGVENRTAAAALVLQPGAPARR